MARFVVNGAELHVRLSLFEKVAALGGNVVVALAAVVAIDVEADPWAALQGTNAHRTGLPWVMVYGRRSTSGGRDFAAVFGRRPAVKVVLDDSASYDRLIVTVADPDATVARLRSATGRR